ncbi:autoinducer binding domain-containing protein [Aeromonas veronii]
MKQEQLFEYLEHFTSVTDGDRLAGLIGRFTVDMGYDYYGFTLIIPMSMQRPKVVLFNQCPISWVQTYTDNNMLACDPVIQLARKQTLPIYWNRLDERASSDLLLESSPILSWMANYIFEAAIRVVRLRDSDQQAALTDRETECLFWASEGKTSGEIACILGITERTVNYHLNQVTRKTGSMNRYQAIAKGISSGILLPNLEHVVVTNFPKLMQ